MDSPRLKTFLVTFTETNAYRVNVQAEDADEALQKAEDLYYQVGPKRPKASTSTTASTAAPMIGKRRR